MPSLEMSEWSERHSEAGPRPAAAAVGLTALTIWGLVAFAVPISVALLSSCSAAAAPQVRTATYACSDGRSFTVRRDDERASIQYADGRYSLSRRPSSIGTKYASPEATLIIDGDFAAFVTETVVDLEGCHEAS